MQNKLVLCGFHWDKKYLTTHSVQNDKITFLSLEMTPNCFGKCLYCFSGPELNIKPKKPLSLEEYKNIILEGKKLGVKTIVFPGVGEPSLDENLKPLVEFNNELGLVSVVYTLGILERDTVEFFREKNVSLIVKLDSLDKNHYEKLVGAKFEDFKKSMDAIIKTYKNAKKEYNGYLITKLATNTVVTNINKDDLDDIAKFCNKHNILHFVETLAKIGWAERNWEELVGKNESELANIAEKYNNWVSSASIDSRCGLFAHGITIDINGDLLGCPTMRSVRLNNIRDVKRNSPLEELIGVCKERIYNSSQYFCFGRTKTSSKDKKEPKLRRNNCLN